MNHRKRYLCSGVATIASIAIAIIGGTQSALAQSQGVVPAQYIMKLYTEGLGRIPTAVEWTSDTSYFAANGCSLTTLAARGGPVFNSTEFSSLGYDNAAKLLALTRLVTNGELAQAEFDYDLSLLDSGAYTWSQLVSAGFGSSQFSALVPAICRNSGRDPSSYWFGYITAFNTIPAPDLPLSSDVGFAGGTGAALQALLNATPSGGTVILRKKSVTRISSVLTIPAGVTLTTANVVSAPPTTAQYALMGRIVLTNPATLQGAAIRLMPGAKVNNVWYDGQKNDYHLHATESLTAGANVGIALWGGSGTQLLNNRVSNSNGWRYVAAFDTLWAATPCTATISGNFLTLYSTKHWLESGSGGHRVSGIEAWCRNTTISSNTIVDASDWAVGIMPFDGTISEQGVYTPCSSDCTPNVSIASYNTSVNAGNSAFVGMGYSAEGSIPGKQVLSFQGSSIRNNVIWAGSRTHIVMATAVGLRTHLGDNANIVDYPQLLNNQIGLDASNPLTTQEAGSFNASYHSSASGNFGWVDITNAGFAATCPLAGTVAAVSATWASWLGTPPGGWLDADMSNCDLE